MPCSYLIDARDGVVHIIANDELHPQELIHLLRTLKLDESYTVSFDLMLDFRTMNPAFPVADLQVLAYYFGAQRSFFRGRLALVVKSSELAQHAKWISWLRSSGIKAAQFSRLSEAEHWLDPKDFKQTRRTQSS